jgi:hypothetical protein
MLLFAMESLRADAFFGAPTLARGTERLKNTLTTSLIFQAANIRRSSALMNQLTAIGAASRFGNLTKSLPHEKR